MADAPIEAEAAQAVFCAIADYVGKSNINKVLNIDKKTGYPTYSSFKNGKLKTPISGLKNIKDLIARAWDQTELPDITLPRIEKFLNDKDGWYESSVLIAKKIINDINDIDKDFQKIQKPNWQEIFYVRGSKASKSRAANAMEQIEALFKVANNNNKEFGDVNKWSPADIYFVSPNAVEMINEEVVSLKTVPKKGKTKLEESYNFTNLNKLVNGLLDSGDLLPLSLKKALNSATLHKYNFSRSVEEKKLAGIIYYGISDWSTKYTLANPKTRDLQIYFSKDKKEKLKFRHDPSNDKFGVTASVKCEIEVTGAGGRGGSAVGIPIISTIIERVDKGLAMDLREAFKKGLAAYEKHLTGKNAPTNFTAMLAGKTKYISLNKKYRVLVGQHKTKLTTPKYEAYKAERAHLSGIYISSYIMPVLYKWFKANESDDIKKAKKNKIGPCSRLAQEFVAYASSRSPKSGKFVIAK